MTRLTAIDIADPGRLESLRRTGLGATPDETFDRFAELAALTLNAPVALVALAGPAHQFFPGAVGLREPLATTRQKPLPESGDGIGLDDLGAIAYAGVPLNDGDGVALGSLCVIDYEPRTWTDRELLTLRTLGVACAAELRLRIAASRTADADTERDRWTAQLTRSLEASEMTASAETVAEIAAAVSSLVPSDKPPAFAALAVVDPDDGLVHLIAPDSFTTTLGPKWRGGRTEDTPLQRCVAEGRQLSYGSRAEILAEFPGLRAEFERLGWQSLICAPLPGDYGIIGALIFGWTESHTVDLAERAVVAAFTGYATQALQRVRRLNDRIAVAETLQRAMLTDLPHRGRLQLAAEYRPAHASDQVGGDWYDVFGLPGNDTALVIGDVAGHDIAAATVMGQLRNMLRGYAIDRPATPADLLSRLDHAATALEIGTTATIAVAYVSLDAAGGGAHLTWSNAGHPPLLLIDPDGRATVLRGHSLLVGTRYNLQRQNFSVDLRTGSTLIFYTDGLIETRGQHIAEGIEKLRLLAEDLAWMPLPELLDALVNELGGPAPADDIAVLGCRILP